MLSVDSPEHTCKLERLLVFFEEFRVLIMVKQVVHDFNRTPGLEQLVGCLH